MKKRLITAACVLFWLAVWQVGAMLLGQELLLVSPVRAAGRLLELIPTEGFLRSVAFSSGRILGGFGLGLTCGTLLALLAGKFRFVRTLLAPLVAAVKAVPVASITVLALVWVSSRNLSVLVTFLIALPVVYSNMLESLGSMDPKLTEMGGTVPHFRVEAVRRGVSLAAPAGILLGGEACHRSELEERRGRRGHRDTIRLHRREALRSESVPRDRRPIRVDHRRDTPELAQREAVSVPRGACGAGGFREERVPLQQAAGA